MKRKLLSIFLILSFVFATCPVLAVQTTVETDKETFLNQFISVPSGITAESASVTRGKYAEALAALLGNDISEMPKNVESKFFDVYGVNSSTMAIVILEQRGIVSGDDVGMFNPDRDITFREAVKMLVTAMGYEKAAQLNGGYPEGYIKTASDISLLKSVSYKSDDKLSGAQLINIFYNALHAKIMKISGFDGNNPIYETGEETFLSGILDVGTYRGVVDATEYTGLYSTEGASKNCVKIDGVEYELTEKTRDIMNYLGYRVDAYYKENGGERTLCAYEFKRNDILKLSASEIESFEDYKLTYYIDDGKKSKTINLSRDIAVIYNGEYTDLYTSDMIVPKLGSITLIANKSDGDYDVLSVENYKNYVVSGVDKEEKKIYNRLAPEYILDLDKDDINYFMTDKNGLDIDISEISVNSIMSVAMSAGGGYAKIIVSNEIVDGAFVSEKITDGDRSFLIGDKYYPVSDDFAQSVPTSGFGGKFFVDFEGNIVYYISSALADQWDFGYIIKVYRDETDDGMKVKLLQSDGIVSDLKFADKTRVNDTTYDSADLEYSHDLYFNEAFQRQLIRYKTNSKNEISKVQTATDDKKSPVGRMDGAVDVTTGVRMRYRSSIQCFNYKVFINSGTKVFVVPEKSKMYSADGSFRMEKIGYIEDNKDYTIQAFSVGENMSDASAIVVIQNRDAIPSTLSDWANLFVVKEKSDVLDEDDEIKTEFVLVNRATENTLRITDNALKNVYFGSASGEYDVEPGDTVRYSVNAEGEINYLQLIYDASENKYQKANSSYINTSFTGDTSMYFGTAYSRPDDSGSRVRVNVGTAENVSLLTLPIEKFQATFVDMSGSVPDISTLSNAAQIRVSEVFGTEKASKVVFMAHQGAPSSMVVYIGR